MLRTIRVFFVELVADHRGRLSPEQNIFSKVHTMHICKSLQETQYHLTLNIRVADASLRHHQALTLKPVPMVSHLRYVGLGFNRCIKCVTLLM